MRKCFLLFLLYVLPIAVWAQTNNIRYDVQLTSANPDTNKACYTKSFTHLSEQQKNQVVAAFVNSCFKSNSIVLHKTINDEISLAEILTGKPAEENNETRMYKTDSVVYLHLKGYSPQYLFNKNGEMCPDTLAYENYETEEFRTYINPGASLYSAFGGMAFEENWDYDNGKFDKEIKACGIFTFNNPLEDGMPVRKRILGALLSTKPGSGKPQPLASDLCYYTRMVPLYNGDHEMGFSPGDNYCSYRDVFKKNKILVNILNDLRNGKVKAYKVVNDRADKSSPVDYTTAINILSGSELKISCTDVEKLRAFQVQKVTPVTERRNIYKTNEYGEYEYDIYGENIVLSYTFDTIGYDTAWEFKREYLEQKIKTDTVYVYKTDEYGDFITAYDSNGNIYNVIKDSLVHRDTIYELKPEIKTKVDLTCKTVINYTQTHNKLKDITHLYFYEDWYLDPEQFHISKKVKGIGLVITYYAELNKEFKNNFLPDKDPEPVTEYKLYIELP